MTNRFINPRPQFLDTAGDPLPNGEMNFYENGTLIRKDTFSDANEDNKNANPLPLNADASMPNCFYSGTARVILTYNDGSGEQQRFDVDGVGAFGSGSAFDIWNSITEYEDGAIVEASDGEYYRSLQNNNIGNDPTSSPSFWEKISFLRDWNANITYADGDGGVVGSDGKIYASIQAANLNNDPTTSPLWWEINNPFDQDLNTTDDPTFDEITATTGINLGGTAAANLLDDYEEEGTWTPVAQFSGGSGVITYTTQEGSYTKIGNMVVITGKIETLSIASRTGTVDIAGLPFTASVSLTRGSISASRGEGLAIPANSNISGDILSTAIDLRKWDAVTGTSLMQHTEWTDDGSLEFSGVYFV